MTDRRVSLPGFNEIARSLPKPQISHTTHTSAAVPQPIPFADRPTYRSSGSPSPHNSYATSNGSTNYLLNRHPSSASYPQQPYSSPPRHVVHSYALSPPGTMAGAGSTSMTLAAGKPMAANNVQMVAQTADPARQMGTPASLPNNTSFMHTPPPTAIPASSRYAPYHMPKGTHPTSSPPMKMCRDSAELNLSRAAAPTLANHRRSPTMTPQQQQQQQVPSANVSSAAAQQQQMQVAHTAHRSHYHQHPASSSGLPMPPPPLLQHQHQPYMALKNKQVKREPSVPELMIEEDEDDDVLDGYDDGRGPSVDDGLGTSGGNGMMTTAKIRTIHKLAERRRRREMKNLFDTLRRCLPIDKTIRLSKWEVLKKAIDVINNQDAEIRMLRLHLDPAKALPPANMS
ncbi:hypothetical protein GGF40_000043 [Coemansia sp. RSA 1286]|nr:hypothetical protein IWW45_009287 [Coemansia sp. RSA 485]KAJ2603049.1 hypothetical protein GGF39_000368 [Coemansia sp. RSA 1721]KAJ2640395.1 hypothetical protein GGF40_000043 [Coemansia sp. RSA 1286]